MRIDASNFTDIHFPEQLQNASLFKVIITTEFKIFFNCILVLIMSIGVVGNGLVIYVVGRFSSMQTPTNIHMMSLSISDCVYLMTIPLTLAVINMENFIFGVVVCKLYMISHGVNWFAGTYSLTVMSIDRYLAVVHPIKSQPVRTTRVTKIIVLFLWVVGLIVMLPLMIYSYVIPTNGWNMEMEYNSTTNVTSLNNETQMFMNPPTKWACQILWSTSQTVMAFTWYTFLLGFMIPVTLISFLYILVIVRLRNVGPDNRSKGRRDSIRRITRLVLAIVIIYIALWLPYWIHQLLLPYLPMSADGIYIGLALQILCYANSAINPVLYGFMSQNFRTMFKQLLCCRKLTEIRTGQSEFSNASQSTRRGQQLNNNADTQAKIETLNKALFETPLNPTTAAGNNHLQHQQQQQQQPLLSDEVKKWPSSEERMSAGKGVNGEEYKLVELGSRNSELTHNNCWFKKDTETCDKDLSPGVLHETEID